MQRRKFLNTSLAASALALTTPSEAQSQAAPAATREFYQLRTYTLRSGPQPALTERFFADALLPALNRRGMAPIGAFRLDIGPETPTFYLLIPSTSLETLVTLDLTLATAFENDEAFLKAAAHFWAAAAAAPAFVRVSTQLLAAFEGWPKLTPPDPHHPRIFQLRTYESPSHAAHVRKVEMFHHGEFDIFARAGFGQVFYGDTLLGPRLPNLTYLLTFPNHAALDAAWDRFRSDPAWKKLSSDPRYNFEDIVSSITNLILTPLACSQV